MKPLLLMVLTALSLGACTNDNAAKDAVKAVLNDPDSAKFGTLQAGNQPGDVCGFVNAKNRMGGYVGETPFVYVKSNESAFLVNPVAERDFRMLWSSIQGGSFSEDLDKVTGQCKAIQQWNSACKTSMTEHHMCDALQGNAKDLYKTLQTAFDK